MKSACAEKHIHIDTQNTNLSKIHTYRSIYTYKSHFENILLNLDRYIFEMGIKLK